MTENRICYKCEEYTGYYDGKYVYCGCSDEKSDTSPQYANCTDIKQQKDIPKKYQKLLNSGRWKLLTKTDSNGDLRRIGVVRKSTGEERHF